jgi:SAM-dependent methyltransferase
MHIYNEQFYNEQSTGSLSSAKKIVPIIKSILSPNSVVDLGCGIGTWLSVFSEQGITDILGIDGPYVDENKLLIPRNCFLAGDLNEPPVVQRTFDLAISLEVAEHIPDSSSDAFVNSLTSLSNAIVFSAAIPFQGGENHINEQWPDYWSEKFITRGFIPVDFLRLDLWDDSSIEFWYRQNIIIYLHSDIAYNYTFPKAVINTKPLSLVHPDQYLQKCKTFSNLENQLKSQQETILHLHNRIEELKDPSKNSTWDAFIFFVRTILKNKKTTI